MVQTTTQINACDAVIKLDSAGGALTDISGSTNSIDMELTNEVGEARTFGNRYMIRMECGKDASITFRAIYSTAQAEAMALLKDWYFTTFGRKTLTIATPNGDPGSDLYTFEVYLESLSFTLDPSEAGPTIVEASLKPSGEFTLATIVS